MDTTQEYVERSFYEAIRLTLVNEGYTPDISNTTAFPQHPSGWDAYLAALETIAKSDKGFAIELFGVGIPHDRGLKAIPRIVVQTGVMDPGSYGYAIHPVTELDPESNKYNSYIYDGKPYDLVLDCMIVAGSQSELRTLLNIVHASIPSLGFLPGLDSGPSFMIEALVTQNTTNPQDETLEMLLSFQIPDIIRTPKKLDLPEVTIEPMVQITVNPLINEHLGISTIIN